MKKYYILATLLLLIFSIISNAQVNYSFTAMTSTYIPVTGGTTPTLINRPYTAYGDKSTTYDEGIADSIPIGFTFNYNGVDYNYIHICANGFATLGAPFIQDTLYVENFYINDLKDGPIQSIDSTTAISDTTFEPNFRGSSAAITKPILAPLWDDLRCQANSDLRYITAGTLGSRVFTFEWANAKWQYDATGSTISFELKIYEGTNVVEFCYKDEGGQPTASASASIGITASKKMGGGFMSLQNTSSSPGISTCDETSTLYKKPADNQVYRFTPLPCNMPVAIHIDTYTNTAVTFGWTAPLGQTNFEYAVTTSACAPTQAGTNTTSSNVTASLLQPGTKYYVHVRAICSASSQSVWAVSQAPDSFVTADNPVPLPYAEGFETLPPHVPYFYNYPLPSNFRIQDLYDSAGFAYNGNYGTPYYPNGLERYNNYWNAVTSPDYVYAPTHSGNGVMFSSLPTSKVDEWFYLPGFNLIQGKSYKLKFYYNTLDPSYNPNALDVKYGQAIGASAMTSGTLFSKTDISNTVYEGDSAVFTPPTSGVYYIGFHSSVDSGTQKGYLLIDDISLEEVSSLPITLLNFSGEVIGKQNLLHWTTVTEINNTGFEVQRSIDGGIFNKIGFVDTRSYNGNSNSKLNYDFSDDYTATTNYYRLKQIDKDGRFSFSNIIVLKDHNLLQRSITLYPNPGKDILNVAIASHGNNKITVVLIDNSGRILQNKIIQVSNGETIIQLDVSALAAGNYLLKIKSADAKVNSVKKFVKK